MITSKESRKSHHVDISVQLSVAAQWAEECCYSELLLIDQSEKALSQAECQYCCRHPVSEDRGRGGHCGRKLSPVIIRHIFMQNFRSILHLWVRVKSICSTEVLVLFYHLEKISDYWIF